MTFDDDARIGRGRVSKRGRGRGVAIGGGGGLVAIVAVFFIAQFTGVDLSELLGASGGGVTGAGGEEVSLEQCETGADANASVDCRMVGAADSLNAFWATEVDGYEDPALVLFTANVDTGCGAATSAVGPFYCPADRQVYIDTAFYDELSSRFGASGGPLAELYVVAHEWGHHIQNLTGRMDQLDRAETGPTSDGVRLELQADCYAGAWARSASTVPDEQGTPYLEPITDQQIADALSAASAVGDDSIQERTSGQVQPETWTHGSSDQRQRWFLTGFENGAGACDTFSVAGADL